MTYLELYRMLYCVLFAVLKAFWYLLPAYIANSIPVVVYKLKFLDWPVDSYKTWHGKRIFGEHKTWRGLFFGIVAGVLITYLQKLTYGFSFFKAISVYDYSNAFLFGFLISFGALFGDLIESFFKRQLNIKPGSDLLFFDQYDFLIGAMIFTFMFMPHDWLVILAMLFISPILHVLANLFKPFFMKS